MKNLHMTVGVGLKEVNASLELKDMVRTKGLDYNYRLAIIDSYKNMKKQLTVLTIVSSIMISTFAILMAFLMQESSQKTALILLMPLVSIILIIIATVYIMNHAGKIYTDARKAYRKGVLGLSKEEAQARLHLTEDEKECLRYFKLVYLFDCILFLISIPVSIMIGFLLGSMIDLYLLSTVIVVLDIVYFISFRIDSSRAEVHRLSTGYYRVPGDKKCRNCLQDTPFLIYSSDALFCTHCGEEIMLQSWEKSTYKMHKKIKWLISRRKTN